MRVTTYDRAAAGLSLACVAHCLALPIIAAFLPAIGAVAEAEWIHWLLTALAVFSSATVIVSAPNARTPGFLLPAILGLVLIVFAVFAENFGIDETPPTVIGGTLLAGAHLYRILR